MYLYLLNSKQIDKRAVLFTFDQGKFHSQIVDREHLSTFFTHYQSEKTTSLLNAEKMIMMMVNKTDNGVWDSGCLPPILSECVKRKSSIWHTRWFAFDMPKVKTEYRI